MWTPANMDACPTQEETRYANDAITELQVELDIAVQELERAQLRVLAITKEIEQRRYWLAPIRKLPVEILSEVFVICSEMADLAPVMISGVSRLWRRIILGTPLAWSFFYPSKEEHSSHIVPYALMFIGRSRPRPLHMTMPGYDILEDEQGLDLPIKTILLAAIGRIRCLSIRPSQIYEVHYDILSNINKLTLMREGTNAPDLLQDYEFPNLRFLDCSQVMWEGPQIFNPITFPPLQHLSITIVSHECWVEAVRCCSPTLKALEIGGGFTNAHPAVYHLNFPVLEHLVLRVHFCTTKDSLWPIEATTPALMSYEEMGVEGVPRYPLHREVGVVTHLLIDTIPDLSSYPALRVLTHEASGNDAARVVQHLERNPRLCPGLEILNISPPTEENVSINTNILTRTRPNLQINVVEEWPDPMPGSFDYARVSNDAHFARRNDSNHR